MLIARSMPQNLFCHKEAQKAPKTEETILSFLCFFVASVVTCLDRFVTMLRLVGGDRCARRELLRSYVLRDVLPRFCQRCEAAISDRLHDHVSDHCCLDWAGKDR